MRGLCGYGFFNDVAASLYSAATSGGEKFLPLMLSLLSLMSMAQILIRKLDEKVVHRLRLKAAEEGVSAEEEARRILARALTAKSPKLSLIEFFGTMPEVEDALFERPKSVSRKVRL